MCLLLLCCCSVLYSQVRALVGLEQQQAIKVWVKANLIAQETGVPLTHRLVRCMCAVCKPYTGPGLAGCQLVAVSCKSPFLPALHASSVDAVQTHAGRGGSVGSHMPHTHAARRHGLKRMCIAALMCSGPVSTPTLAATLTYALVSLAPHTQVESVLGKELPASYRQASRNWQDYVSPDSEYYITPLHILAGVRKVFGGRIDCDPCSDEKANEVVGAEVWFGAEDDGLAASNVWSGRVYINPPSGMVNNDNIQVRHGTACGGSHAWCAPQLAREPLQRGMSGCGCVYAKPTCILLPSGRRMLCMGSPRTWRVLACNA